MQHINVLTLPVVLQEGQGQDHNNNNSVKLHPACTQSKSLTRQQFFEQVVRKMLYWRNPQVHTSIMPITKCTYFALNQRV
jgi:hypothetical protein